MWRREELIKTKDLRQEKNWATTRFFVPWSIQIVARYKINYDTPKGIVAQSRQIKSLEVNVWDRTIIRYNC